MYLIAENQGAYIAYPIHPDDQWDIRTMPDGERDRYILCRINGKEYLLFASRKLCISYSCVDAAHIDALCNSIIEAIYQRILQSPECVDISWIINTILGQHQIRWRSAGLLPPEILEYPENPNVAILTSCVRIEMVDVIRMDHEPPTDECDEELPY